MYISKGRACPLSAFCTECSCERAASRSRTRTSFASICASTPAPRAARPSIWGWGFGVWSLGFEFRVLEFGVWVLGFGFWGLGPAV